MQISAFLRVRGVARARSVIAARSLGGLADKALANRIQNNFGSRSEAQGLNGVTEVAIDRTGRQVQSSAEVCARCQPGTHRLTQHSQDPVAHAEAMLIFHAFLQVGAMREYGRVLAHVLGSLCRGTVQRTFKAV